MFKLTFLQLLTLVELIDLNGENKADEGDIHLTDVLYDLAQPHICLIKLT